MVTNAMFTFWYMIYLKHRLTYLTETFFSLIL